MTSKKRIYLSPPHMSGREIEMVQDAIASNWIAPLGPHVDGFEKELCQFTGASHAVALSSGTAAIHLALTVFGVKTGDEVLCSTFTFAGSVNPIVYCGALPVLVESESSSWNMSPEFLREAIAHRKRLGVKPKALILVHLYGQSADIDPIADICRENGIELIEDAAESMGAYYKGRHTGTIGRMGIFSFNGNKIITTSGGGALISNEKALVDRVRHLSTQAREPFPHYEHTSIGFNYRMSNIIAAIGRGQLTALKGFVEARRRNFDYYHEKLGGLDGIEFMPEAPFGRSNRWLTCITVDAEKFGATNIDLLNRLADDNIEARPLWKPMHLQPVFSHCPYYGDGLSEKLFNKGLCLPSGSAMSTEDLDRVIDIIMATAKGKG